MTSRYGRRAAARSRTVLDSRTMRSASRLRARSAGLYYGALAHAIARSAHMPAKVAAPRRTGTDSSRQLSACDRTMLIYRGGSHLAGADVIEVQPTRLRAAVQNEGHRTTQVGHSLCGRLSARRRPVPRRVRALDAVTNEVIVYRAGACEGCKFLQRRWRTREPSIVERDRRSSSCEQSRVLAYETGEYWPTSRRYRSQAAARSPVLMPVMIKGLAVPQPSLAYRRRPAPSLASKLT